MPLNKKLLKELFFTIPSFIVLIIVNLVVLNINFIDLSNNFLLFLILLLTVSEVVVFGQMFYLMIHTSKNEKFDIGKKISWIITIYLLNIFSIPIYVYLYLLDDEKFKVKSLVHIIISAITILFTIFSFCFLITTSFVNPSVQYLTKDNSVMVTVDSKYEMINTDYDLYLHNEEKQLTFAFFTYDLNLYNYTEEDILYYQIDFFNEAKDEFQLHKAIQTVDMGDRKITYLEFLGTMEGYGKSIYRFSTVTFDENEKFILYAIQVVSPDMYVKYNEEMFNVLKTAELIK